jgi:Domain of unknown function (DUF6265)
MIEYATMNPSSSPRPHRTAAALLALCLAATALPLLAQTPAAQTPAAAEPAKAAPVPLEFGSLAWLEGCWRGDVAKYLIREHWLPPGGGIMVGAGHTLLDGKSSDYQYLRLETRPNGVYYVSIGSDRKEASFKLTGATTSDGNDTIFTFTNVASEFPERILYRRGAEGWLYASVEGKVKGEEKKVIYPLRRIDCQSGEFIRK